MLSILPNYHGPYPEHTNFNGETIFGRLVLVSSNGARHVYNYTDVCHTPFLFEADATVSQYKMGLLNCEITSNTHKYQGLTLGDYLGEDLANYTSFIGGSVSNSRFLEDNEIVNMAFGHDNAQGKYMDFKVFYFVTIDDLSSGDYDVINLPNKESYSPNVADGFGMDPQLCSESVAPLCGSRILIPSYDAGDPCDARNLRDYVNTMNPPVELDHRTPYSNTAFPSGTIVRAFCSNNGRSGTITCHDGNWRSTISILDFCSDDVATCTPSKLNRIGNAVGLRNLESPKLTSIPNVLFTSSCENRNHVVHGDTCLLNCGDGYFTDINQQLTCVNGSWSGTARCIPASEARDMPRAEVTLLDFDNMRHRVHVCFDYANIGGLPVALNWAVTMIGLASTTDDFLPIDQYQTVVNPGCVSLVYDATQDIDKHVKAYVQVTDSLGRVTRSDDFYYDHCSHIEARGGTGYDPFIQAHPALISDKIHLRIEITSKAQNAKMFFIDRDSEEPLSEQYAWSSYEANGWNTELRDQFGCIKYLTRSFSFSQLQSAGVNFNWLSETRNIYFTLRFEYSYQLSKIWFGTEKWIEATGKKDLTFAVNIPETWQVAYSVRGQNVWASPTNIPTAIPSTSPTLSPTTDKPSYVPSRLPTTSPSADPSVRPSETPSVVPTVGPSFDPSVCPTRHPSGGPSRTPSVQPSDHPTPTPSDRPSWQPTLLPSHQPSHTPSVDPSRQPTVQPSVEPSTTPSWGPTRTFESPHMYYDHANEVNQHMYDLAEACHPPYHSVDTFTACEDAAEQLVNRNFLGYKTWPNSILGCIASEDSVVFNVESGTTNPTSNSPVQLVCKLDDDELGATVITAYFILGWIYPYSINSVSVNRQLSSALRSDCTRCGEDLSKIGVEESKVTEHSNGEKRQELSQKYRFSFDTRIQCGSHTGKVVFDIEARWDDRDHVQNHAIMEELLFSSSNAYACAGTQGDFLKGVTTTALYSLTKPEYSIAGVNWALDGSAELILGRKLYIQNYIDIPSLNNQVKTVKLKSLDIHQTNGPFNVVICNDCQDRTKYPLLDYQDFGGILRPDIDKNTIVFGISLHREMFHPNERITFVVSMEADFGTLTKTSGRRELYDEELQNEITLKIAPIRSNSSIPSFINGNVAGLLAGDRIGMRVITDDERLSPLLHQHDVELDNGDFNEQVPYLWHVSFNLEFDYPKGYKCNLTPPTSPFGDLNSEYPYRIRSFHPEEDVMYAGDFIIHCSPTEHIKNSNLIKLIICLGIVLLCVALGVYYKFGSEVELGGCFTDRQRNSSDAKFHFDDQHHHIPLTAISSKKIEDLTKEDALRTVDVQTPEVQPVEV